MLTAIAGLVEVELDGCVCLYDPDTQQVLVLNQTASDVWVLCDGAHTHEDVVRLLASSYRADPDAIRGDVAAVLGTLRQAGLLLT